MSTTLNFCTLFDRSYAAQGVSLYRSLERHCRSAFQLTILRIDSETHEGLARLSLPHARPALHPHAAPGLSRIVSGPHYSQPQTQLLGFLRHLRNQSLVFG